jgi:hypothetical protein
VVRRRVVEPKDETKKKLGRSPDGMDALNLAYSQYTIIPPVPRPEPQRLEPGGGSRRLGGGCSDGAAKNPATILAKRAAGAYPGTDEHLPRSQP